MELRDIEYFAVIAEHGNLGRAADALGLSQPALSKSLRRLEQALQVKLVKRTPKGVELTAEGSVLLLRVRELRLSLQGVAREIADVSQGRVGHLRIGVSAAISEQLLSVAFAKLLKDAPRTKLIVSVSDNDLMVSALCNGELDLIIHYVPVTPPEGVVCQHLYDSEYVVCASVKHRLAGRKQVTLAELAQERWALNELTLPAQQRLLEKFRDSGFPPPRVAFQSRSAALRLRTVGSSDLLTIVSRDCIEQATSAATVITLPVNALAWLRPVGVIFRRETYLPPVGRRFIEIIKAMAKDMAVQRGAKRTSAKESG
jgi:DNA-binding transcriptional LysR family regulator